ncbi:MAG: aminoglycoside phosphotransferase family protein [Bdellovibrionales bacterium]|nr:aminoglycoside phosphotransferase family protein [Bdellovibrionales bacterium]
MNTLENKARIFSSFDIPGELLGFEPLVRGHIHDTFVSSWKQGKGTVRYLHQKMNDYVFKDIPVLMRNIVTITEHVRAKIHERETGDETLTVIPLRSGESYLRDENGHFWRTFLFVDNTTAFDECVSAHVGFEAGAIVGRFLDYVSDIEPTSISDTIPFFHHTPKRYEQFGLALEEDVCERKQECREQIDFALTHADFGATIVKALEEGTIPTRISHNDTKLNNILFSEETNNALCLVDLDTCMAGSPLYDYGDLLRTACPMTDEDDADGMCVSVERLESLTRGFLFGTKGTLSEQELSLLPLAPAIITLTIGLRFLTDYLAGDKYFKIHQPGHNLQRTKAQFRLVTQFLDLQDKISAIIECR